MSLLPDRPAGDADELRRAAAAWSAAAQDVAALAPRLSAAVSQMHWRGPAAGAFSAGWASFETSLSDGAAAFAAEQPVLERIADQVADAQRRWDVTMAGMALAGAVGLGLALFTFGTSLVADTAAAAADTAVLLAIAQGLADLLGVEVAAMLAAVDLATALMARWTALFTCQLASEVAFNVVTGGDGNPLDANLGAAAVTAAVVTAVPAALGTLSRSLPVAVPPLVLSYAEGVAMDATLQASFGHTAFSWTESLTVGGGLNAFVGRTVTGSEARPRPAR